MAAEGSDVSGEPVAQRGASERGDPLCAGVGRGIVPQSQSGAPLPRHDPAQRLGPQSRTSQSLRFAHFRGLRQPERSPVQKRIGITHISSHFFNNIFKNLELYVTK